MVRWLESNMKEENLVKWAQNTFMEPDSLASLALLIALSWLCRGEAGKAEGAWWVGQLCGLSCEPYLQSLLPVGPVTHSYEAAFPLSFCRA